MACHCSDGGQPCYKQLVNKEVETINRYLLNACYVSGDVGEEILLGGLEIMARKETGQ